MQKMHLLKIINCDGSWELQLLGVTIVSFCTKALVVKGGFRLFSSLRSRYFEYIARTELSESGVYWVSRANIGENLLLAAFLSHRLKIDGLPPPVVVGTKSNLNEVFSIVDSQLKFVSVPLSDVFVWNELPSGSYKYEGCEFRVFMNLDDWRWRFSARRSSKTRHKHYYDSLAEHLGMNIDELSVGKFEIPDQFKLSARLKLERLGLREDEFVYILPAARTCRDLEPGVWRELIARIRQEGYDVLSNSNLPCFDEGSVKYCDMCLSEACMAAKLSRSVVGLRSGLLELLACTTESGIHALYSGIPVKGYSASEALKVYSMDRIPWVGGLLVEYDTDICSSEELVDKLVTGIFR